MSIVGWKAICLAAAAGGFWSLAAVSPASASCAAPPTAVDEALRAAPVVFVGRVVATSHDDRQAVMNIVSQWRGPALPAQVTVVGTPELGAAATSVDRRYRTGSVYLVVPVNTSAPFADNACTMTREYTADLAQYAPTDARAYPTPGPDPPGIPVPAILVGAATALVLAAVITVVVVRTRYRRARADSASGSG